MGLGHHGGRVFFIGKYGKNLLKYLSTKHLPVPWKAVTLLRVISDNVDFYFCSNQNFDERVGPHCGSNFTKESILINHKAEMLWDIVWLKCLHPVRKLE